MCFVFFWLKMNEWMNENMSTWTYSFGFFSFKYFNKIHCFLLLTPVSYAFFVIDNDDIPDSCLGYMASWLHKMSETFPYRPVLLKKGFVYWSRELNMNIDTVAITFTTKYNIFVCATDMTVIIMVSNSLNLFISCFVVLFMCMHCKLI